MLVSCVAYQNGLKLADIALSDISEYVSKPDCFVWVAVKDPSRAELAELQEEFGLHDLAVEDAHHGYQRPKVEEYGRSLFVVLPIVELTGSELHTGELAVFAGDNYVFSVRHRAERGFVDLRHRIEAEPELLRHGSGYVLYALLDTVVDRYFPVISALSSSLEDIEERIFADQPTRSTIEALYVLKQKLAVVQHGVGPLLEAADKLYGGRVPRICASLQDYFRDVHDHLVRLSQAIDKLRDTSNTATSTSLALITLQESEVTKRLAAYAALVAVPTMVAGVYGMNFEYMPELRSPFGYPTALIFMAIIDAYLFYRFRKAKWL